MAAWDAIGGKNESVNIAEQGVLRFPEEVGQFELLLIATDRLFLSDFVIGIRKMLPQEFLVSLGDIMPVTLTKGNERELFAT